ncbi:MAG: GNAT family N-acetyltransferase [Anaerolineales bacterium]
MIDIIIRPLAGAEEMEQAEDLQRAVWPGSETDIVPAHLLLTVASNGGLVLGALADDRLVGYVMGFLGTDEESPDRVAMARLKHCSHQVGVLPDYRGQGLAFELKRAQREALIRQGIRLATWTYDPLMSVNAYLNIHRLGAVCRTYKREVYGEMRDGLNQGLPSDRFQVDWWVTSNRVESRIEGSRPPLDLANYLSAGAQKLNSAGLAKDDLPRPGDGVEEPSGKLVLVEIPPDFVEVKRLDMGLASEWRSLTRSIFEGAFEAGYVATDFVYLKGEKYPRSYYVLSSGESTLG